MRPGRGLKYREGWVLTRHTQPAKPNVGGNAPTSGEGGAWARVHDLWTFPLRSEARARERERERERGSTFGGCGASLQVVHDSLACEGGTQTELWLHTCNCLFHATFTRLEDRRRQTIRACVRNSCESSVTFLLFKLI